MVIKKKYNIENSVNDLEKHNCPNKYQIGMWADFVLGFCVAKPGLEPIPQPGSNHDQSSSL